MSWASKLLGEQDPGRPKPLSEISIPFLGQSTFETCGLRRGLRLFGPSGDRLRAQERASGSLLDLGALDAEGTLRFRRAPGEAPFARRGVAIGGHGCCIGSRRGRGRLRLRRAKRGHTREAAMPPGGASP